MGCDRNYRAKESSQSGRVQRSMHDETKRAWDRGTSTARQKANTGGLAADGHTLKPIVRVCYPRARAVRATQTTAARPGSMEDGGREELGQGHGWTRSHDGLCAPLPDGFSTVLQPGTRVAARQLGDRDRGWTARRRDERTDGRGVRSRAGRGAEDRGGNTARNGYLCCPTNMRGSTDRGGWDDEENKTQWQTWTHTGPVAMAATRAQPQDAP